MSYSKVASASYDKTIRLWDAHSGRCLQTLKGHEGGVFCLLVLDNGNIISGSADKTLRVWDGGSGNQLKVFSGHEGPVRCLGLLPNGNIVSGSRDRTLRIWTMEGKQVAVLKRADGKEGHDGEVDCLTVLGNGSIVSGSDDETIRLWSSTGAHVKVISAGGSANSQQVRCLTTTKDNRVVAGGCGLFVSIWDQNGNFLKRLNGHNGYIVSVAVMNNGNLISGALDNSIRVWEKTSYNLLQIFNRNPSSVRCLAIMNNGNIISGSAQNDHSLTAWNWHSGAAELEFKAAAVDAKNWTCETCTLINPAVRTACAACGKPAPLSAAQSLSNREVWAVAVTKPLFPEPPPPLEEPAEIIGPEALPQEAAIPPEPRKPEPLKLSDIKEPEKPEIKSPEGKQQNIKDPVVRPEWTEEETWIAIRAPFPMLQFFRLREFWALTQEDLKEMLEELASKFTLSQYMTDQFNLVYQCRPQASASGRGNVMSMAIMANNAEPLSPSAVARPYNDSEPPPPPPEFKPVVEIIRDMTIKPEQAIEKLEKVAQRADVKPQVRQMAQDVVYVTRHFKPRPNCPNCQGGRGGKMNLLNVFVTMYYDMLNTADSAWNDLRRMAAALHRSQPDTAKEHFVTAKKSCVRVGLTIQHVIDCKFETSEYKCPKGRACDSKTCPFWDNNPKTHLHPRVQFGGNATNEVPPVFAGKGFNEQVLFDGRKQSHLDYIHAKAEKCFQRFHEEMFRVALKLGHYEKGPLKAKHRCHAKVANEFPKDLNKYPGAPQSMHLKDILRGTLICKNLGLINEGLSRLGTKFQIVSIKFRLQTITHDFLVNFVFEGLVAELQFHLVDFYPLKKFAHGPYEVARAEEYTELLEEGILKMEEFQLDSALTPVPEPLS